ncbi:MAG TPA: hypothetical protein VHP32_05675 [Ignavibacteria bacterium]|nr:hypothetical protein [Ignavibacteria bacterium]
MSKVIILATKRKNFWEKANDADFLETEVNFKEFKNNFELPVIAIGRYYKDSSKEKFSYIKIKDIRNFDSKVYFSFEPFLKSDIESNKLEDWLRSFNFNYRLACSVDTNKISEFYKKNSNLIPSFFIRSNHKEEITWKDYVGKYYLELENELNDNDFEDRVARLLQALGFEVIQIGYKIIGAYADGVALIKNVNTKYGIVYDCKNSNSFYPEDKFLRALEKYREHEINKRDISELHPVFISKKFEKIEKSEKFRCQYFEIESLLFLLSVKLKKGNLFTLSPFKNILSSKQTLSIDLIKKEWELNN